MNQAADIRNRLRGVARERKIDMQLLLTTYGIQRMLHRLGKTSHARRYTPKGAQLLQVLSLEHAFRATRDVDLAAQGDPSADALRQVMLDLANLDEDDGLVFDVEPVEAQRIVEWASYHGVRDRFAAHLAGACSRRWFGTGNVELIRGVLDATTSPERSPLRRPCGQRT